MPLNGRSTLMEISGDIEVKTVPEKKSSWINNSIGLDIIGQFRQLIHVAKDLSLIFVCELIQKASVTS